MKHFLSFITVFTLGFNSQSQTLYRSYYNGFSVIPLNDSIAKTVNCQSKKGLLVQRVVPGSTSANAGIQINDIVLELNTIPIKETADLKRGKLASLKENSLVTYKVWRNGEFKLLTGVAVSRPLETKNSIVYTYGAVPYKNGLLRSLISQPNDIKSKRPAILFIQGYTCSGNTDLDVLHPYRRLTDGLTEAGFLVMRIEKPGMGDNENTPPCDEIDVNQEAEAFEKALLFLKKNPNVDTSNIFIWGHSMGGVIAPMLTSKYTWVKGAIVYGTVNLIWGEYVLKMTRLQSEGFGVSPVEVEKTVREMRKILYEIFTLKKSPSQFVKENSTLKNTMQQQFGWQEGTDKLFTRSAAFSQTLDDINLNELWSKTKSKVLAFYGEADIEALNDEGAKSIVSIVNQYNPGSATYHFLPQTDHSFAKVGTIQDGYKTKADPNYSSLMIQKFNPEVVNVSTNWLKSIINLNEYNIDSKATFSSHTANTYQWKKQKTEPYRGKQDDVFFINENNGWYGNGEGKLYNTINGGENWNLISNKPGTFIRCLGFLDSLHGFIGNVGTDYFPDVKDTVPLYETFDGGKNWKPVTNIKGPYPKGLCAIDIYKKMYINKGKPAYKNIIRAAGRVGGPAFLMTSTDEGKNWKSENMNNYCAAIFDIHFTTLDTGFICGATDADVEKSNAIILRTTNGGKTWQKVYQSNRPFELTWKCSFPNSKTGFVTLQNYNPDNSVTQRSIIKTIDGGNTWNELPLENNFNLREFGVGFINEQVGFVGTTVGGYQTTDGGTTWTKTNIGSYTNKFRVLDVRNKTIVVGIGENIYVKEFFKN